MAVKKWRIIGKAESLALSRQLFTVKGNLFAICDSFSGISGFAFL